MARYPPPPATGGVTETIHGVTIHDPFRALEDEDAQSTKSYVKAQNAASTSRPLPANSAAVHSYP